MDQLYAGGVISRIVSKWREKGSECTTSLDYNAIRITSVLSAFAMLIIGSFLSLLFLVSEIYIFIRKKKTRNRIKVETLKRMVRN